MKKQTIKSKVHKLIPGDTVVEYFCAKQIKKIEKTQNKNWVRIFFVTDHPGVKMSKLFNLNDDIEVEI